LVPNAQMRAVRSARPRRFHVSHANTGQLGANEKERKSVGAWVGVVVDVCVGG
jgi:hypothetical protein